MKTIIGIFRDSFAFKLTVGIISFLFSYQTNIGLEQDKQEVESHITEISFEKKFLEINPVYFNDPLVY